MSSYSQCTNLLVKPSDLFMVLLPLESALVCLLCVKLNDTINYFNLQFCSVAQQRSHYCFIPRSGACWDVVIGFNEGEYLSFIDFEHLCDFLDWNLGVVLENGIDSDVLQLFESSSHQIVGLIALNKIYFTFWWVEENKTTWASLLKLTLSFCFRR